VWRSCRVGLQVQIPRSFRLQSFTLRAVSVRYYLELIPIPASATKTSPMDAPMTPMTPSSIPILWRKSTIPVHPLSRSSTRVDTGESKFLALPVEIFSQVLETFIHSYGVHAAMRLRTVCRAPRTIPVQAPKTLTLL